MKQKLFFTFAFCFLLTYLKANKFTSLYSLHNKANLFKSKIAQIRKNDQELFSVDKHFYSTGNIWIKYNGDLTQRPDVYYSTTPDLPVIEEQKLSYNESINQYFFNPSPDNIYVLFYTMKQGDEVQKITITTIYVSGDNFFIKATYPKCLNTNIDPFFTVTLSSDVIKDLSNLKVILGKEDDEFPLVEVGNNEYMKEQPMPSGDYLLIINEKDKENSYAFVEDFTFTETQVKIPEYIFEDSTSITFHSTCPFSLKSFSIGQKSNVINCNSTSSFSDSLFNCNIKSPITGITYGRQDIFISENDTGMKCFVSSTLDSESTIFDLEFSNNVLIPGENQIQIISSTYYMQTINEFIIKIDSGGFK